MSTPHQRIANRANATHSTGPTSADGRKVSRANALTHGLTASTVLLDDEDEEVFETFHQALSDELRPDGPVETELADRLITLMWRSRRIAGFEAALLEWMGHWSSEYYDVDSTQKGKEGLSDRVQTFHNGLRPYDRSLSPERRKHLTIGRLLHEGMNNDLIAKLSRYEAHVLNQLRRTHAEFEAQQDRRRARPAEALARLNAMLELEASNAADSTTTHHDPGPTDWP